MTLRLALQEFSWSDLFVPERLKDLDGRFLDELARAKPDLHRRLVGYRSSRGEGMEPEAISELLVEAAPHVGAFVARLFGVEQAAGALSTGTRAFDPVFRLKKSELVKQALRRPPPDTLDADLDRRARALLELGFGVAPASQDDELAVATAACVLIDLAAALKKGTSADAAALRARLGDLSPDTDDKTFVDKQYETLELWLSARRRDPRLHHWVSLQKPHAVVYEELVQIRRPSKDFGEMFVGPEEHRRSRDGFKLTDPRMNRLEVQSEVEYCIYCHERDKDSCSKGLHEKNGAVKTNPLSIPLAGCPLGEKISEAHLLKKSGDSLAALAAIAIDNPMLPGTGHRICNDCMKSCIYQKQEPVNIPQIETRILTDVLELPWGFEIYGLFTRWNPLNARRPYPLPYHGKNVLVVGLGPAGYTLAHHLLNEGFGVIGIDGLKVEPPPKSWVDHPIESIQSICGPLDDRVLAGFGGVSEYGITVRWDKNFLDILHLTLARREKLRMFGGVRFGGTVTLEDAWDLGFDHVAIAAGAGKPTIIDLENNLLPGVRKASDFLMALQLTGAYKRHALANLQVRLPALVIGGGLTAIDTATELRAYYVVQVEKTLERYEALCEESGEPDVRHRYSREELVILDEFLEHGRAIREERRLAALHQRAPSFDALLESWGGVSIAYRKRLQDSPAYRLNHEEVIKCLEEGVRFLENMSPKAALPDENGFVRALTFTRADKSLVEVPARTVCVAAGTSPNTTYEREKRGSFELDKKGFFRAHVARRAEDGQIHLEPGDGFFTSYRDSAGHVVSYYGDNHPKYAGSVVKAMASAKDGFPKVTALFEKEIAAALADPAGQPAREQAFGTLSAKLADEWAATVAEVRRLTPTIVEVVVRAPAQARRFHPGQFYRLQNYETEAPVVGGYRLLMEGIALTGAWVDPAQGLLSLIVLEMGTSSRLCAALKVGEPVVVMGPTGAPTDIPQSETVLLAGGGLGNAVLFSIAKALEGAGNKVIYFAGYKKPDDIFKRDEIEQSTHQVIWSSDVGPPIEVRRPQDRGFVGNIVQAMVAYAKGELGTPIACMDHVDRIIAIGSDRMMAAVAAARHKILAPYLKPDHVAIGSINSPMQCMMKEVCAQCLQ